MTSAFYLPRSLSSSDKIYSEAELIAASNHVVVLAEPGGGKTELMNSIAHQLGTTAITASKFVHMGAMKDRVPLVIDAFDELAKVDNSGIYQVLGKAKELSPTHFYLSSRSSEWDSAATNSYSEFFGHPPQVFRLFEFDETEQRAIFDRHAPGEDFEAFQAELALFDLEALLPNPQFLKLFADAYLESGRHFTDKRSIFAQAVERLAKEANPNIKNINPQSSIINKANLSSEVFTKLLLSGAEGVCTNEACETRMYPLLASLFDDDTVADVILATRLFKPSDSTDQHRPTHKIVSEYCAANYLTKRIADPADPLTLSKCLPIIAPNSTVRDELRGLLGWMAALGNKPIQESAIDLDPYSVLANGDPSQLAKSSKRLLLQRLKEVETQNPYFRRGDSWRRFSVAEFFTQDIVEEIKPILAAGSGGHLRDLILELLAGSTAIEQLTEELHQLALSPTESKNTRMLAARCLLDIPAHDHRSDLDALLSEASSTALEIAAETVKTLGLETIEPTFLVEFLQVCSKLYPGHKERLEGAIGKRYFLKKFIKGLSFSTKEWLLDELTRDLACICGEESYKCNCRNGISKLVGSILDSYFEVAEPPFDPKQVWQWVGNLNFHERKGTEQSKAVEVLQREDKLRHGIIADVFGKLTDRNEINKTLRDQFGWHSHSGLNFCKGDLKFLVNLAFDTNNPDLWVSFIALHQYYPTNRERGADGLRRHMREQAREKPIFMQEWAKANRARAQDYERDERLSQGKRSRRMERHRRKQAETRATNIKYIQSNRELIESGHHLGCLVEFSKLMLMHPENIEREVGDEELVRAALRNCINFITPQVPSLLQLAELKCESRVSLPVQILHAACLEILRAGGSLESVDLKLLMALRTALHIGYEAVSDEERDALEIEVDRLIFPDSASAENFLRQYLEPQLARSGCTNPELWLLRNNAAFRHLRASLSIEWLNRFRTLDLGTLDTLFEISAQFGNLDELQQIIADRCAELMSDWPSLFENERTFWLMRAWYFLNDAPGTCWDWLKEDKNTVLALAELSGQMSYREHDYWPKLTSSKVEAILDAFIDRWPKVDLPGTWGTGSPKEESAYRFITEVIWLIGSDDHDDAAPVLERLLADMRFADLHNGLKSIQADQERKKALKNFEPPTPREIVDRLDLDVVVTVEGLRELVIQELLDLQKAIDGSEFNISDRFYENGERLDEVRSTEIVAERLHLRLEPQGISVTPEHQLKNANRSDFTVTKMIGGRRRLLVTEVKGQWHRELYTAASAQLHERYSIHPDAEQQGIYLVIWFGVAEKVANRTKHDIESAQELKTRIEERLPQQLRGLIDVFVLDVSKP